MNSKTENGPDDVMKADDLPPSIYEQLRKLAAGKLANESPGQTLDATALVHEAWLKLSGTFENRGHFFAAAAEAMRRILIDHARSKCAEKRGGARRRVSFEEALTLAHSPDGLLELDEALTQLASIEPAKAKLVTLRFFGGLTSREAAETLGISEATAERWWLFARTWLLAHLRS